MGAEGVMYVNPGDAGRVSRIARLAHVRASTVRMWLSGQRISDWACSAIEEAMARLGWSPGGR